MTLVRKGEVHGRDDPRAGGGHGGFEPDLGRSTLERRLQGQGTRAPAAWLAVPAAIGFHRRHADPAGCQARAPALMHRFVRASVQVYKCDEVLRRLGTR